MAKKHYTKTEMAGWLKQLGDKRSKSALMKLSWADLKEAVDQYGTSREMIQRVIKETKLPASGAELFGNMNLVPDPEATAGPSKVRPQGKSLGTSLTERELARIAAQEADAELLQNLQLQADDLLAEQAAIPEDTPQGKAAPKPKKGAKKGAKRIKLKLADGQVVEINPPMGGAGSAGGGPRGLPRVPMGRAPSPTRKGPRRPTGPGIPTNASPEAHARLMAELEESLGRGQRQARIDRAVAQLDELDDLKADQKWRYDSARKLHGYKHKPTFLRALKRAPLKTLGVGALRTLGAVGSGAGYLWLADELGFFGDDQAGDDAFLNRAMFGESINPRIEAALQRNSMKRTTAMMDQASDMTELLGQVQMEMLLEGQESVVSQAASVYKQGAMQRLLEAGLL